MIEEEDYSVLNQLEEWIDIHNTSSSTLYSIMDDNLEFYKGRQYSPEDVENLAEWKATPVENIIFPNVEQSRALFGNVKTDAQVIKENNGNARISRIIDSMIEAKWDEHDIDITKDLMRFDLLVKGTAVWRVEYDSNNKSNTVPTIVERIDSRDFVYDPLCKNDIEKARFAGYGERVALSDLLEEFPDKYEEIQASQSDSFKDAFLNNDPYQLNGMPSVEVWDIWFKDTAMLVELEEDPETGEEKIKSSKRKYPTTRHVRFVGDVVLIDEKSPYNKKFGNYPFVVVPCISVPNQLFGDAPVTYMKDEQVELNNLLGDVYDHIRETTNPAIMATRGAIDFNTFFNAPNTICTINNIEGARIERFPQGQLPQEVFGMINRKSESADRTSGLGDAAHGSLIGSARTGIARQNLEASTARINRYLQNEIDGLKKVAQKLIHIFQSKIPKNTIMTMRNPFDDMADNFDAKDQKILHKVMQNPDIKREYEVVDLQINQENPDFANKMNEAQAGGLSREDALNLLYSQNIVEFKNDIKKGEYKYKIEISSYQPEDEQAVFEKIIELIKYTGDSFVIPEMILDFFPLPKHSKMKILSEFKKRQQAQQEAEQQQLAMQQQAQLQQPEGGVPA